MRLLLIRHGQTPSNVAGLLDTRVPGPGLTDLGRTQAAALPGQLAGEGIGALLVSTMVRTHETAAPLAAALGLEPIERDGIREVAAAGLEMRGDDAAVEEYMGTVFRWAGGETSIRLAGGETGDEFAARYDAVVAEAEALGHEVVALISHGAAIRCWAGLRSLDLDARFIADHLLDNTGVVVLEGSGDAWTLVSWQGEPVSGVGAAAPSGPAGETTV
ncbi:MULTISPECIES: histidine phosphatase family protein [unclassified Rathayibacter]|uniref:histidine phosphatase family protein n=1 Tax=unclassified Rathayibacter TaxID=2609250 RepID=UPI000CE8D7EE|nr:MULTISPECIES: histidine phosphatase family protein [unclassified Rathayibacter]PPF67516.1 histidine phosphatase family protein [Rathayibacter sp. AY1E6]PPG36685.1 histidine phosphatase family protein [Rathayibacter sp. AY2B5]PPH13527.1 histidine phosphatase family protein [Rathayibacter sp. AY1F8]PPH71233.1 histidine phosphatase family protein [Rathayibacter sp. AY1D4]PPH85698.1 histidine phosphatase family protein [Rathayibacter sp. AY1D3]